MLTGIHFLLTYKCIYECDHCFVYSSPRSEGTFTFEQVCRVLDEAIKIGTIESIYFEGGEPFLYYPLLVDSVRAANECGFKAGIVTNAYFANSFDDACRWLKPFADIETRISDLSISDDLFHNSGQGESNASIAIRAAKSLGINTGSICIDAPEEKQNSSDRKKGEPVIGGGVMFKGRAAEKLAAGLPRVNWKEFTECPHEELENPERVHVDSYGNVHICQGISMGNMWQTPLAELVKNYSAGSHPVCRYLVEGGPAALISQYKLLHEDSCIDACHLCFEARKKLISKFPEFLAPLQVYDIQSEV